MIVEFFSFLWKLFCATITKYNQTHHNKMVKPTKVHQNILLVTLSMH